MPTIVPGFEYDIFISYRHNDNRSGWVTDFVNALQEELAATIKEPLSIYFDKNPHDGLLETHDVDKSLEGKLKCLIFIPIISQTYCDPKSFAWQHEFCAFNKLSKEDSIGRDIKLSNGNVASRILPIKIHDISIEDKATIETELGSQLRAIEFIYKEPGVNRPLKLSDDRNININKTDYRNQINKTANAVSNLISALHGKESKNSTTLSDFVPNPTKLKPKIKLPQFEKRSIALLVLLVSLIAVSFLYFQKLTDEERTYRVTLLTPDKNQFTGSFSNSFSISPDGHALAFVATDSTGKSQLWVRKLNSLKAQMLTQSEENASVPFWSPDSRYIAFFADGMLKKVEATGGPTEEICRAPQGRGGSWNKDGTIIFCGDVAKPILRVSANGGAPSRVTKLDTARKEFSHRWPVFLPDGRHFLFLSRISSAGLNEQDAIFLASLDTTVAPRLLVKVSSNMAFAHGHLVYGRNGILMAQPFDEGNLEIKGDAFPMVDHIYFDGLTSLTAFSVSQTGHLGYIEDVLGGSNPRLIWRDRSGKQLSQINHVSGVYYNIRISPDGTTAAICFPDPAGNRDMWLYESTREIWTRFTFHDAIDQRPVWSPNGKMIVFSSERNKKLDLYIKPANGERSEQLLFNSDQGINPIDWSRDGRFIAFQSYPPGVSSDIWILPMNAEGTAKQSEPFPFLNSEFYEARPAFSPDGKWIAYQSDESGKQEVYIRPFPGPGGKFKVSTNGGTRARWRADGKELFFIQGPDFTILSAEIELGKSTVKVGAIKSLFKFRNIIDGGRDSYDVTPDGQRFLTESLPGDEIYAPITLVINWQADLKKK